MHLGSRKAKVNKIENIYTSAKKLYRADIIDVNDNYLAKTVKSIDIGIKSSDVIDKRKLLLRLNIIVHDKKYNEIKKKINKKKYIWLKKKI